MLTECEYTTLWPHSQKQHKKLQFTLKCYHRKNTVPLLWKPLFTCSADIWSVAYERLVSEYSYQRGDHVVDWLWLKSSGIFMKKHTTQTFHGLPLVFCTYSVRACTWAFCKLVYFWFLEVWGNESVCFLRFLALIGAQCFLPLHHQAWKTLTTVPFLSKKQVGWFAVVLDVSALFQMSNDKLILHDVWFLPSMYILMERILFSLK